MWLQRPNGEIKGKVNSQGEDIDHKGTFSPVSTKDSFRVIMAIMVYFDFEVYQIDVRTTFLNGDLSEDIYMVQVPGYEVAGKKNIVCKL